MLSIKLCVHTELCLELIELLLGMFAVLGLWLIHTEL